MAKPTVDSLNRTLDGLERRYAAEFAGRARHTRDLEVIEKLASKAAAVLAKARKLPRKGRGVSALVERAFERTRTYRTEARAIAEAQTVGRPRVELQGLVTRGALLDKRYRRCFAGQARVTRDLELLRDIAWTLRQTIAGLETLVEEHPELAPEAELDRWHGQVALLGDEEEAIVEAQAGVSDPAERVGTLATLANAQFAAYRTLFGGKPRASRSLRALDRITVSLERLSREMGDPAVLAAGGAQAADNLRLVEQQLAGCRAERGAIAEAQAAMRPSERAGHLGAAANEVFKAYRIHFAGQDRRTRDLPLMDQLCERLAELEGEMFDLASQGAGRANADNLEVVRRTWSSYEDEREKIREAQQGPPPPTPIQDATGFLNLLDR